MKVNKKQTHKNKHIGILYKINHVMYAGWGKRGLSVLNLSSTKVDTDLAATTTAAVALTSATGTFFSRTSQNTPPPPMSKCVR